MDAHIALCDGAGDGMTIWGDSGEDNFFLAARELNLLSGGI